MRYGPVLLELSKNICPPEGLKDQIRDPAKLCTKIQEENEFAELPFTVISIRPWYEITGLTGYELLFILKGKRILEISRGGDIAIEHHLELTRDLPKTILTGLKGRKLQEIVNGISAMEPYWRKDAEILDIVTTNNVPWAVFHPK